MIYKINSANNIFLFCFTNCKCRRKLDYKLIPSFCYRFFPFNFLKLNLPLPLVLVEDEEVPVAAFLELFVSVFDELVDEDTATPLLLLLSHLLELLYSEVEWCFSLNFFLLFPLFLVVVGLFCALFFFFLLLLELDSSSLFDF